MQNENVVCFLLGISPASQMPGKYPKENILHNEHGESLKSRQNENVSLIHHMKNEELPYNHIQSYTSSKERSS